MDINRIRRALHEVAAASGTAATPGAGAIGGGVAGFKNRMGTQSPEDWYPKNEEVKPSPLAPGVVQSIQHASDAQLINPMAGKLAETTHEVVNLNEIEGSGTKTGFPTQTTSDVIPIGADGRQSKPIMPVQGNYGGIKCEAEETPPQGEIQPLALGEISLEGYFAIENGKPTLVRYKVLKGGTPIPVDPKKTNSKDIGHTKEQVLKKLSMMPQKIPFIKKFIKYNKDNDTTLKNKQQENMG